MNILFRLLVLFCCVSILSGCGGSAPQGETTPMSQSEESTDAATRPATDSPPEETTIVENKQLVVAFKEQLKSKYEEMSLPTSFIDLLVKARVEFVIPEQFEGAEPVANNVWQYDYRLTSKTGKVDILIKIFPGEITEKNVQGNIITASNELMTIMIRLNGAELVADIQDHPQSEASSRFNATMYTTGTFQPISAVSDKPIASAGIFYKEGYGRVVVISLMDDLSDGDTRTEWITGANALRFADNPVEQ